MCSTGKPSCWPQLIGWGVVGLLVATPLSAAEEPKPRWEWGVGVAAATLRDYAGSDNYRSHVLPFPWLVWRSERLHIGQGGTHGVLWRGLDSELDLTLSLNPSARQSDNPLRAGMPKLDPLLETGLRLRLDLWRDEASGWVVDAKLPLRRALAWDDGTLSGVGWHAEPGLSLGKNLTPGWFWDVSAAANFVDRNYASYFYGVDPIYATTSRPAFRAEAGYGGWQLGSRLQYQHQRQRWNLFLRLEGLEGARFADSPLVTTLHAGTVGIAWMYRLGVSRKTVQFDDEP